MCVFLPVAAAGKSRVFVARSSSLDEIWDGRRGGGPSGIATRGLPAAVLISALAMARGGVALFDEFRFEFFFSFLFSPNGDAYSLDWASCAHIRFVAARS